MLPSKFEGGVGVNDIKEIGKRMREKRKELSMTLDEVADTVKVAKSTIQRYETGKIETPKIPVVREIAKALGVSSQWLLGDNDTTGEDYAYIPLLGEVAAGMGAWADNRVDDYIVESAAAKEKDKDLIYLKVTGDSMYPEFHEGDLVLVECTPSVESGSFAVVIVDNENGVVKRLMYGDDYIELLSVNPMYPPRIFKGADTARIRVFGKVVGLKRNF